MGRDFNEIAIKVIHLCLALGLVMIMVSLSSCENSVACDVGETPVIVDVDEHKKILSDADKVFLYNECCKQVKKYESFSSERYLDNDGSITIGYGHHIKKGEKIPTKITEEQASKIFSGDFDAYLKIAGKYGDTYNRQLAIAMFTYNVGEGRYRESTLKKLIDLNLPIDLEIVKWCHFKSNGETHTSSGLLKRRRFELSVYNIRG